MTHMQWAMDYESYPTNISFFKSQPRSSLDHRGQNRKFEFSRKFNDIFFIFAHNISVNRSLLLAVIQFPMSIPWGQ